MVEHRGAAKPFLLIVAFWGEDFRRHFLQLCLASLLSPGNIPSLSGKRLCRVVMCTTRQDWAAIQAEPIFFTLQQYAEAVFLELRSIPPDFLKPMVREWNHRKTTVQAEPFQEDDLSVSPLDAATPEAFATLQGIGRELGLELTSHHEYAMRIFFMSAGHKAAAALAHQEKAFGVFLAPDMVLSDGSLTHLHRLALSGTKVVMVPACRFSLEDSLQKFQVNGFLKPDQPLVLPPRKLVEMVFACPHPETACFEFDSPVFSNPATSAMWKVAGDDGGLLHSFFWAPLLVSYHEMNIHHLDYFDKGGTTDGKYIAMHFHPNRDVTPITDSDEVFLASFTPRGEYSYRVKAGILKRIPGIGRLYKISLIRRTLYGPMGDLIKRNLYAYPVRIHSQDLSPAWNTVESLAAGIVERALKPPGILGRAVMTFYWITHLFSGPNLIGRIRNVAGYALGYVHPEIRQRIKHILSRLGF